MFHFESDYNQGCLPEVLKALEEMNDRSFSGYAKDRLTSDVNQRLANHIGCDPDRMFYLTTGTQANTLAISFLLKNWQGVIAADEAHLKLKEAGSIEKLGHKVIGCPTEEGKISLAALQRVYSTYTGSEHMVEPAILAITQPTEAGTLYSLRELSALSAFCQEHGLLLYLDGARLFYALASKKNDVSLNDILQLTDCFYVGGNKCGALFGELLIFNNKKLDVSHFRHFLKQHGALLAKGWLMPLQFETLFHENLALSHCGKADDYALQIAGLLEKSGLPLLFPVESNQLFFEVDQETYHRIQEKCVVKLWKQEADRVTIRLVTSWSTSEEAVQAILSAIQSSVE